MNTNDKLSMATEELKALSSIIGRLENAIYQKQGWLFTLIAGLILAFLKDNPLIGDVQFLFISILITLVFLSIEIIQRISVHWAIKRSEIIEEFLSGKLNDYEGPKISKTLSQDKSWKVIKELLLRPRVMIFYGGIIVINLIIFTFTPCR